MCLTCTSTCLFFSHCLKALKIKFYVPVFIFICWSANAAFMNDIINVWIDITVKRHVKMKSYPIGLRLIESTCIIRCEHRQGNALRMSRICLYNDKTCRVMDKSKSQTRGIDLRNHSFIFFGWSRYQHQKFRENCIVRIAQDAQVFPQFLVSIPRSTKNILHWLLIISFCCFPTFICGFETVLLTTLLSTYFRLVLIKVSTKFLGQTESSFLNNNNRN